MGYDLHITRKKRWTDEEGLIPVQEWLRIVASDPALVQDPNDPNAAFFGDSELEWLTWNRGTIYTKNPSERIVNEMIRLASDLNAVVMGDDGEVYERGGKVNPAAAPRLWERVRNWWRDRVSKTASLPSVESPFRVGDRVRDIFGDQNVASITKIDLRANNGLGSIEVRYDDGRVGKWFCVGHGLEPVEDAIDDDVQQK